MVRLRVHLEVHFMPFVPGGADGPAGVSIEKAFYSLDKPGWQRWFYALDSANDKIIGHVDLKSDGLVTGLHRCEIGIGIERTYRKQGLGKLLMCQAIDFARVSDTLAWIDLKVFATNTVACALYKSLGFVEIGTLNDRFRIDGQKIDDIVMVLNVE